MPIWRASVDPRGTIVEDYLKSRGLELGDFLGNAIRHHAGIGMVALFRSITTNYPQATSRTFLGADARKISRRFFGPVAGAAIKLDSDTDVLGGIHIGEGIETCLAARQLRLRPCWALGSKSAIAAFPVLAGVECLTILAEPDAERETQRCADRWHQAGREVLITRVVGGKDANDVIMGVRR
jgi:hypothetical protein